MDLIHKTLITKLGYNAAHLNRNPVLAPLCGLCRSCDAGSEITLALA
jgi:hypothetical protein